MHETQKCEQRFGWVLKREVGSQYMINVNNMRSVSFGNVKLKHLETYLKLTQAPDYDCSTSSSSSSTTEHTRINFPKWLSQRHFISRIKFIKCSQEESHVAICSRVPDLLPGAWDPKPTSLLSSGCCTCPIAAGGVGHCGRLELRPRHRARTSVPSPDLSGTKGKGLNRSSLPWPSETEIPSACSLWTLLMR